MYSLAAVIGGTFEDEVELTFNEYIKLKLCLAELRGIDVGDRQQFEDLMVSWATS
jgi:hypothetical protein